MKKTLKKRSKRIDTKTRCKAEKKVREFNRKLRRDKKRNPGKFAKSKKDPGVPNDCPFKEAVLQECEAARKQKVLDKDKRREEAKKRRAAAKEVQSAKGLQGLVLDAQRKQAVHDSGLSLVQDLKQNKGVTDRSAKAYYKEFLKVVETADVILEVLDARDPLGTRCKEVESAVISNNKRLVLVLNKADLVPKTNLESWLKCLRGELPSVAFKSSTQNQGSRLGHSRTDIAKTTEQQMQTSKCVGASTLMALLANYCRNKDIKTSIRVGVVGLPNVGKSSLINSLKRSRACSVGSTPGVTKNMQEVQLDSKIKLLDSPGMVLASGNMTDAGVALRNAIKVETMDDPVKPVQAILARCPKSQMMLQYHIQDFEGDQEFLNLVARSLGKLKKGGLPNTDMAARAVINDWNSGRIKYFTHPPEAKASSFVNAQIVQEFAKEFSLNDLDKMDQDDLKDLPHVLNSDTMLIESSGIVNEADKNDGGMDVEEDDDDDEDEDEDLEENVGQLSNRITVEAKKKKADNKDVPRFKSEGLARMKKASKAREKKEKKDRRRRDKVATELSHNLESALASL